MIAAARADLRTEVVAQQQADEDQAIAEARAARIAAGRASPHWPFGTLTPMQQRTRAAQEAHMRAEALRRLPAALW